MLNKPTRTGIVEKLKKMLSDPQAPGAQTTFLPLI